jgi:hypothetical protein
MPQTNLGSYLNLLEADADCIGKLFLRYALGEPRAPHPPADMNVRGANPAAADGVVFP